MQSHELVGGVQMKEEKEREREMKRDSRSRPGLGSCGKWQ